MPQSPHDLRVSERPVRSDFGREKSYARRRLLTLTVLAALIGGILYYVWGGGPSNPADIPTIKADGTYKQKPADPGGIDIPHQDVRIYDELENKGAAPDQVEHLLPPPETPEFAGKPVPPAPVAQTAPIPAPLPPVAAPSEAPAPTRMQSLDELAGVTRKPTAITAPPAPQPTPVAPAPSPQVATIDQVIKNISPSASAKASVRQAPARATGTAVIQLASSNDRVKAQAMMQNLQQKYADQLGDAVLHLQRADLGSKGVFYRIQSQGLSADEASQICASLKNQNAGCILVRK